LGPITGGKRVYGNMNIAIRAPHLFAGVLIDSNELDEMPLASPALVADRLLLRTEKRLYSIRKKS